MQSLKNEELKREKVTWDVYKKGKNGQAKILYRKKV